MPRFSCCCVVVAASHGPFLPVCTQRRAAFSGGLSQPLMPDPDTLGSLTPEAVHEFVAAHFTPPNMTLAVAGASLGALTNAAGPLLATVRAGASAAAPASKYTGGVLCALAPGSVPTVSLAFQVTRGGLF